MKLISLNCPQCGEVMEVKKQDDYDIAICPNCASQYMVLDDGVSKDALLKAKKEKQIEKEIKKNMVYVKILSILAVLFGICCFVSLFLLTYDQNVAHWTTNGSLKQPSGFLWLVFGFFIFSMIAISNINKVKKNIRAIKRNSDM